MTEHRMLAGSHESRIGPQCLCGSEWDWWEDVCVAEVRAVIAAKRAERQSN